jgi:phosphohistidine phosphatase
MTVRMTELLKLFLLRHAKSSWDDPELDDFDRPLNGRGRKAARAMGKYLERQAIRPSLVLVSAAARTRATFELIAPRLDGAPSVVEAGLYEASSTQLLERLRRLDDRDPSVMLVAHNPGLEQLALTLCGEDDASEALARLRDKFPTGALAVLEAELGHWAELAPGTCRLAAFVRPKELEG